MRKNQPHSKESKLKMSISRTGHFTSDETRQKIGIANSGRIRTEENKKKISNAMIGKVHSEETKLKMRKNNVRHMLGKKHTKETILKMKKPHGPMSEECKQKIRESLSGEKCWLWNGGISREPYSIDWTKTLKRSIRERDHYTCQICSDEPAVYVHHIDYNKKNCNSNNLITLCISCHAKTNYNREYWKERLESFHESHL
jgi:hypothetical protein